MNAPCETTHREDRYSQAERLLADAVEQHRAGELAAATERYERLLALDPGHADAWHLHGFAALQGGNFDAAVRRIRRAITIRAQSGEFHYNLGLALLGMNDVAQAELEIERADRCGYQDESGLLCLAWEMLQRGEFSVAQAALQLAVRFAPASADAHHLLGLAHKRAGDTQQAIASYRHALDLRPDFLEALNNLGNAWRDADHPDRAVPHYRRAIELDPTFATGWNNLGLAYHLLGDLGSAEACFQQSAQIDPASADPLNNLGNLYRDAGSLAEALRCFEQAIQRDPSCAELHNNLAVALRYLHRHDEAVQSFEQSLARQPASSRVLTNLATTLVEVGRYEEAVARFYQAAALEPDPRPWQLRAAVICPAVFPDAESMDKCWVDLHRAVQQCGHLSLPQRLSELVYVAGHPPFNLQFFPHNVREFKTAYARRFSGLGQRHPRWARARMARYRVGFLVTSRHEGVFLKSLGGVLDRLDAQQFDVHIFCARAGLEVLRRGVRRVAAQFVVLPSRLDWAADVIRSSQLDLLYFWEIGTDAMNYFLPFLRLAPVQCTSWGVQVTSGIPQVDYYLSSELVEPAGAQQHYSERLVMANTLLCFRHRPLPTALPSLRSRWGFDTADHVYACPQQLGKLHPDFDRPLAQLLRRDPQGKLVITADPHGRGARVLRARHQRVMPDVADRIVYLPRQSHHDYLGLLQISDVLLDPPYFGGVNTTYDGLGLGKPIVTCPGSFHRSRYTYACYRKLQMYDCVAADFEQYVDLALRLGTDREYRDSIGRQLVDRAELLFEDDGDLAEHERLLRELIET